jgi:hypothetical protein
VRSDKTLKKWYNRINRRFFHNVLPSNICVRWISEEDLEEDEYLEEDFSGLAWKEEGEPRHYGTIVISNDMRRDWRLAMAILVHEMCHVATDFRDEHGPAFEEWRQTIGDRGIFRKGAIYKGLTIF